jgi:hypothetical protein
VGSAPPGFAQDAGKLIGLPAFHLLVVAFTVAPLRLVAGPAQTTRQQSADVVGVVHDAKVPADHLGDAGRGPQFIRETVRRSALVQEVFQLP